MSMAGTDIAAHYEAQLQTFAADGAGEDWLHALRAQAMARFVKTGFPTPRQEDWKYTRVDAISKRPFVQAPAVTSTLQADDVRKLALCPEPFARLVFVDGQFNLGLSSFGPQDAGLKVQSLREALAVNPGTVREKLARLGEAAENGFALLNTAFAGEGVLIEADTGLIAPGPVEIMFVSSGQREDIAAHAQIWLRLTDGASLEVVENYASFSAAPGLTNVTTQCQLDRGARLNHIKLQNESDQHYHVASLHGQLKADARLKSVSISTGSRLARNDIEVKLCGEGARVQLDGLMLASSRQHTDYHTRVDHLVPNASSGELYKGIFDDRSRGVFNGRVYVHPGADGSEAHQQNHNLMLSRNAEVDTKPQLEIYADEVKCSHGATVGQLEENMLFYLRSRGLSEAAANGLLVYGFAQEMLDCIENLAVRSAASRHVLARLPGGQEIGDMADE